MRLVTPNTNTAPPSMSPKNTISIMTESKRNAEVIRRISFLSIGFNAPQANNTVHPAINMALPYIAN